MKEITPGELKARLEGPNPPLLLDVREDYEVQVSALPGSRHIPLGNIQQGAEDLAAHKNDPIVVYCRSGKRSASATLFLESCGFQDVTNLAGGITAWKNELEPAMQVA